MKHTLQFTIEKETKGAVRYTEQGVGQFDEPVVGTLYVRKSTFKSLGKIPQSLTVTVEVD
jgi:hypothetical protein